MRLSPKGRHAVTALLDLALHQNPNAVTLAEIAARQSISTSYLEQLFRHLREAGVVHGTRGPGGGYRLARHASEITLGDVVRAVEGTSLGAPSGREKHNLPQVLWQEVSESLYALLDSMTLGELIRRPARAPADVHALPLRRRSAA